MRGETGRFFEQVPATIVGLDRLIADDKFLFKVVVECLIDSGELWGMLSVRGVVEGDGGGVVVVVECLIGSGVL